MVFVFALVLTFGITVLWKGRREAYLLARAGASTCITASSFLFSKNLFSFAVSMLQSKFKGFPDVGGVVRRQGILPCSQGGPCSERAKWIRYRAASPLFGSQSD